MRPVRSHHRLILVDGPAGAGKTTWAAGLAAGLASPLVHLEDLYLGWSGLEGAFERLESLVLRPWLAGSDGRFQAYDWLAGGPTGDWIDVPAANCLVVEGCGCAPRRAAAYDPAIVWMDGPRQRRWERVLERDGEWERPLLAEWEAATTAHHQREQTAVRAGLRLIDGADGSGSSGDSCD